MSYREWRHCYLVEKDHHRISLWLRILQKSGFYKYYPAKDRAYKDLNHDL